MELTYRSGWLPPTPYLRTDTSYPNGLIYRLTVVGAFHAFRSHSLLDFKYIADPKPLLFSALGTRVFRLQNERRWTSWET